MRSDFCVELKASLGSFLANLIVQEWYDKIDLIGDSFFLFNQIGKMLVKTLGVGISISPRDPETSQIIIDTLCEASVPFTMKLLLYILSDDFSPTIPQDLLPTPNENLRGQFSDFWNNFELKFMRIEDGKLICLTTDIHMNYAVSIGGSAWQDFLRASLPADKSVILEIGELAKVSWTTDFDKHSSEKGIEERDRIMKRQTAGTEAIIRLAEKVTGK